MPHSRLDITEEGFGLVELVIAMFLLAIITIALIPALYNGILYSSQQSTTATATRQLNTLVEQARKTHSCAAVAAAAGSQTFSDGASQKFTTAGTYDCTVIPAKLNITATGVNGTTLATVNALVYLQ